MKILYFDIETSPCTAFVWHPGKQYVGIDQIQKDRKVLTVSYMFNTDKKPTTMVCDLSKHKLHKYDDDADKQMLKAFSTVYNTADMVVAHNGKRFDLPIMRARLVKFGLPDLQPTLFDDTYPLTKSLGFISHKLDYLSKALIGEGKIKVDYKLWVDVMYGDKGALQRMAEYNAVDVIRLKQIHEKLMPYIKSTLNQSVYKEDTTICISPGCNGKLKIRDGNIMTRTGKKVKKQCVKCGKYCTLGINLVSGASSYPRSV